MLLDQIHVGYRMAIQAGLYPENVAFPFIADDICGGGSHPSQDFIQNANFGLDDFYLFNLQHQQQQQQQYQLPQSSPKYQDSSFINNAFNKPMSINSRFVAANIQKQNQEIEGFINLQNERLRLALQAHRKQQFLTILKNYESKSELLLKQKDDEIKQATNRRIELEEFLRRTDIERQKWQSAANETEELVMNLNNTIEELSVNWKKDVEDEGSCCHDENDDEKMKKKMMCKNCFDQDSCVVMLPCRHLCSCKSCDVFLHSCPVCKMAKKATIQLSFSDFSL